MLQPLQAEADDNEVPVHFNQFVSKEQVIDSIYLNQLLIILNRFSLSFCEKGIKVFQLCIPILCQQENVLKTNKDICNCQSHLSSYNTFQERPEDDERPNSTVPKLPSIVPHPQDRTTPTQSGLRKLQVRQEILKISKIINILFRSILPIFKISRPPDTPSNDIMIFG